MAVLLRSSTTNTISAITTNREIITADKTLTNEDPSIQILENPTGGDLNLNLPTSPTKDKLFGVVNLDISTGNIIFNSRTLIPSDRYEIVYDGTEWVEI